MVQNNSLPIRVGIRGAAGLLGSRLAAALARTKDMRFSVGVVVPDRTLERAMARQSIISATEQLLPQPLFVAAGNHGEREYAAVERLQTTYPRASFRGLSQLNWRKTCDVIIDTAYPAGKETVEQPYLSFPGVILLQDGAAPEGQLIIPPLLGNSGSMPSKVYRLGDCMLAGIVPLVYQFLPYSLRIRLHVLTQYTEREADYLITERTNAVYVRDDLRQKLERELTELLPQQEVSVSAVIQVPSLLHYQFTIEFDLSEPLAHEHVRQLLQHMPRVQLLPEVVTSTYDLNLARSLNEAIAPITVFTSSIWPAPGEHSRRVRLVAAVYYRSAAVLPNLDAIRMTVQGLDPLAAMRQTDTDMNFPPKRAC